MIVTQGEKRKLLTIKIVYFIVFVTLIFWSILAYVTLIELVDSQKKYANLINVSGKQRMLSQKTTLFVKRYYESRDERVYEHLVEIKNLMKSDHKFMIKNLTSQNIKDIYFKEPYNLDKKVNEYISLLEDFMKTPALEKISIIQDYSFELLPQLNFAVNQFENELSQKTVDLEQREFYILIFGLGTLILEALLIIIPSIQRNEKNIAQLQKMNVILEKKVKKAVKKVKKKDEVINRHSKIVIISKLIDNIAHYWRQPLSVISANASGMLLKKEYGQLDDEELKKSLDDIVQNSSYLSQTIEKYRVLFDSKEEKKEFKLLDVYNSSLNVLKEQYNQNQINTYEEIEEDISMIGFESELQQVLIFMYENASDIFVKRKIENRKVLTKISSFDKKELLISIYDNAEGIDNKIKEKLYSDTVDLENRDITSGMASYISNEIIKNSFNGRLEVSNEDFEIEGNKYFGACFKIYLPIK